MIKATWNGQLLAQSNHTVVVEGNHYFPPDSILPEYFKPSETTTFCGWKGDCKYYHLMVDGQTNSDAAWYYPEPYARAEHIKGHLAFWKGVQVQAH